MDNLVKWWFVFALIIVAFVLLTITGTVSTIVAADTSYLCIGITILFFCGSIYCGRANWKLARGHQINKGRILDMGMLLGTTCSKLGLLGTIVGFIMMVTGLASLNLADPSSMLGMISAMSYGIGVALYTTLVGLVCNILLSVQYFMFERALKEKGIDV